MIADPWEAHTARGQTDEAMRKLAPMLRARGLTDAELIDVALAIDDVADQVADIYARAY